MGNGDIYIYIIIINCIYMRVVIQKKKSQFLCTYEYEYDLLSFWGALVCIYIYTYIVVFINCHILSAKSLASQCFFLTLFLLKLTVLSANVIFLSATY